MSLSYKWTILIGKKNKEIIEMKQKKYFTKMMTMFTKYIQSLLKIGILILGWITWS
jgi:hypothetical protein